MMNYFVESKTYNPWENLAIEKHLADNIRPGDLFFYLWQNDKTVVIGRNQNALRECRTQLLEAEGGYLARRSTGGGAVYQDMGNLCFTFLASPERYDLTRQLGVLQRACRTFGIKTEFSGRNDVITKDGLKFSGNAFSVNKRCNIQHGTLMIDVDTKNLARYLTPSEEKIKAKGVKSVESRVCNLKTINADVTVEKMKMALLDAFREEYGEYEQPELGQICARKSSEFEKTYSQYASWDWRYGKSPSCEMTHSTRFPWGEVQIHLKFKNLYVEECKVYSDSLDAEFPEQLENILRHQRFDMGDIDHNDKKIYDVIQWLACSYGLFGVLANRLHCK